MMVASRNARLRIDPPPRGLEGRLAGRGVELGLLGLGSRLERLGLLGRDLGRRDLPLEVPPRLAPGREHDGLLTLVGHEAANVERVGLAVLGKLVGDAPVRFAARVVAHGLDLDDLAAEVFAREWLHVLFDPLVQSDDHVAGDESRRREGDFGVAAKADEAHGRGRAAFALAERRFGHGDGVDGFEKLRAARLGELDVGRGPFRRLWRRLGRRGVARLPAGLVVRFAITGLGRVGASLRISRLVPVARILVGGF